MDNPPAEITIETPQSPSSTKSSIIYQYTTLEFDKFERTPTWYMIFSLIGILLLSYAIIERAPLMFFVFLLTFVVTLLISRKDPKEVQVTITPSGVAVGKNMYLFTDIESFGVFRHTDSAFLSLYLSKGIIHYNRVPLGKEDPEEIANIISQFVPREDGKESFFDIFDYILKI